MNQAGFAELKAQLMLAVNDNRKKLRPSDVRSLRRDWDSGSFTQTELASDYQVNRATVSRIVRGIYHPRVR